MPISIQAVEGDCVFDKDGTFVYLRHGDYVAYVAVSGLFIEATPAGDLDGALDMIQREMSELGVLS